MMQGWAIGGIVATSRRQRLQFSATNNFFLRQTNRSTALALLRHRLMSQTRLPIGVSRGGAQGARAPAPKSFHWQYLESCDFASPKTPGFGESAQQPAQYATRVLCHTHYWFEVQRLHKISVLLQTLIFHSCARALCNGGITGGAETYIFVSL